MPSGTVSYRPPDRHTTKNMGATPVHGFLRELKR
jgi:hypothetical protein